MELPVELKPILQIYPVMPADSEDHRAALRPIGRNRGIYNDVVLGWSDIVRAADKSNFWGLATIEHHFWSEGYEVGPNPGILNAYWAAQTSRIRIGALGYVMSTQNPIRVAEETAILSHLTQGRFFVGFARGFQARWTNVLGQHYGAVATRSPTAENRMKPGDSGAMRAKMLADDAQNRAVFEEQVEIVLKAWSQDSIEHNGKVWQIPYPYEAGIEGWQLAQSGVSAWLGAPGEVDDKGIIRRVSVCPAPYAIPPIFVSGSGSPETVAYCARNGFVPVFFTNIEVGERLSHHYQREAAAAGRTWHRGQNQCMVRWIKIAETDEQAREDLYAHDYDLFKNFSGSMGNRKVTRENFFEELDATGFWIYGSVETVRRKFVEQWTRFPAEYVTIILHYAQMPKEKVIRTMQIFDQEIKPALDEVLRQAYAGEPALP